MTKRPTEREVREYLKELSNWGRWGEGAGGLLGTLNLIGPEEVLAASALVRSGRVVSCALPFEYGADGTGDEVASRLVPGEAEMPVHYLLTDAASLTPSPSPRRQGVFDGFMVESHGKLVTHLDAPCHTVFDGTLFNGVPAHEVFVGGMAVAGGIDLVAGGICGRGVLLDVPGVLGRAWLEDSDQIMPEDLNECAEKEGVSVRSGDCLLVRTGYRVPTRPRTPTGPGYARPGLQAACLPWLSKTDVALLGADVPQDCMPHGYDGIGLPIHTVGMWAMGLWLLDNCALEELAAACRDRGTYEFLFVVAPLTLPGGTGSPVNPLAVL